jgi:hypothetical protein
MNRIGVLNFEAYSGVGLPLRFHDLRRTPPPGLQQRKGSQLMSRRDNEEHAVSRGVSLGRQRLVTPAASALFTGHAGAYGGFIPKPKSRP